MGIKRGLSFKRIALVLIIIISIFNIIGNFLLYENYVRVSKTAISAYVGNQGTISLTVENALSDTTPPGVSITDPENTTYTSHRTSLSYKVSDSSLQACWYSLDSGKTNTTITCGNNVSSITSSADSNTWKVYANDTSGNENSSSVTFSVSISGAAAAAAAAGGGGGGRGAAGVVISREFSVAPEEINFFLVAGTSDEKEIKIINTGDAKLTIDISASGVNEIVSLNANQVVLKPGEEESLLLSITAPESGIHAGKIIFKSGNLRKDIFVLVNVKSEKALFDVSVSVPESYKVISPGENVMAFISLVPIGDSIESDVTVNYVIKNFEGKTLFTESETFFMLEAKSFVKEYPTSKLDDGDYLVGIEVTYPGGFATSSAHFAVESVVLLSPKNLSILLLILLILAIIVIVYSILRLRRYKKKRAYLNSIKRLNKK